jgi:hypothetical protein
VERRSESERPTRSIDHTIATSKRRRLASLSIRLSAGRLVVLIDLYNRQSAPLTVGNTGDSGFVATAVGMGTRIGLSHPLPVPLHRSRNGTGRFLSLRMPRIVPSNRRLRFDGLSFSGDAARSATATLLHPLFHLANASMSGRCAALLRRGLVIAGSAP